MLVRLYASSAIGPKRTLKWSTYKHNFRVHYGQITAGEYSLIPIQQTEMETPEIKIKRDRPVHSVQLYS